MPAIKGERVEESDDHKKKKKKSEKEFFFFSTQEKWNEMNFKNATLKVFEDERGEGGRRVE